MTEVLYTASEFRSLMHLSDAEMCKWLIQNKHLQKLALCTELRYLKNIGLKEAKEIANKYYLTTEDIQKIDALFNKSQSWTESLSKDQCYNIFSYFFVF